MRQRAIITGAGAVLVLFAVVAAWAQPVQGGIREASLESKVLGEQRTLRIWTPASYDGSVRRYPVLYLTDAETQIFHTAATVDFLARQQRMPEMIVVGVTNTDRTRDLTPTRGTIVGENLPDFPTSGGGNRFLRFFETELMSWVDRTYRTEPFRVFAGHSFGGLFAVHAFLSKPDLFNAVIAVSPTLRWDGDLPLGQARDFAAARANTALKRTFVFTIGSEGAENDRAFDELEKILGGASIRDFAWAAYRFADEDHGSVVLPSHYAALRKIFASWRLPVGPDGTFAGSITDVVAHYRQLAEQMGYHVTPPETTVNALGYQRLGQNRIDEAIAFFRYNIETHPNSANVYDSLGEALEAKGDLPAALELYERAVSQGEQTKDPLLPAFLGHRDAARAKVSQKSQEHYRP